MRVCLARTFATVTEMGPFPRYLKLCILGSWDYLLADSCSHVFLWWRSSYLRWDVECFILQHFCYPPRQRENTRIMTTCTFKITTLPRTTVDNKPKQNWTTDSPSPLLAHWKRLRISVQLVTLASVRSFFVIKRIGASLAYTFIIETCLQFFFPELGCFY